MASGGNSIIGNVLLAARGFGTAAGRTIIGASVSLFGRSFVKIAGFASPSGTVPLSARSAALASGDGNSLAGTVLLAARGLTTALGRAAIGTRQLVLLYASALAKASGFSALSAVPPAPVTTPTGGGGKRKKKPVRPIWDIQREKEAAAAAAAVAPAQTSKPAELAPTAAPSAPAPAAKPLGPWLPAQLLPDQREDAKVLPFVRRTRAHLASTEDDDGLDAAAQAPAGLHANLQVEDDDRLAADAEAPAGVALHHAEGHDRADAAMHIDPVFAHAMLRDDHDQVQANGFANDDEDAIALLLDALD